MRYVFKMNGRQIFFSDANGIIGFEGSRIADNKSKLGTFNALQPVKDASLSLLPEKIFKDRLNHFSRLGTPRLQLCNAGERAPQTIDGRAASGSWTFPGKPLELPRSGLNHRPVPVPVFQKTGHGRTAPAKAGDRSAEEESF